MRATVLKFVTASLLAMFATAGVGADHAADANELAVGSRSKISGQVSVPLRKPESFNFKTREQILTIRRQAVESTPNLLLYRYTPNQAIFSAIEDKKPWWGLSGSAVFGKGDRSITGPSEESRFILNPYLLVGANSATSGIWDARKLSPADLNSATFPYFWQPDSLVWDPRNCRAAATYNVRRYLNEINNNGKLKGPAMPNHFSLVAYNARDFGYNFIFLDLAASTNIANATRVDQAAPIMQMIHCGGSCGYPGGCNNMSPYTAEIDRLALKAAPARAVIKLWKARPASTAQAADFTFIIDFQ